MKLVVGVVTYEDASLKYLEYFLPSLQQALSFLPDNVYQVMAFDNSSLNDNRNRLALEYFYHQHHWPFKYFSANKNLGFGAAYNILINKALELQAEYFLIINPDTLVDKESIEKLIIALDKNLRYSAASPKILRWNFKSLEKTKQLDSCGLQLKPGLRFYDIGQGEFDLGQYDQAAIICPSGAAALFRLNTLVKLKDNFGFFDERFFMYKEDCDLAYRFKAKNLQSLLVADSVIYHDRSMAFYGKSLLSFWRNRRTLSKAARAWSFRNQHLLFYKYFSHEDINSRISIIRQVLLLFIYSLILENFNLREYKKIIQFIKY